MTASDTGGGGGGHQFHLVSSGEFGSVSIGDSSGGVPMFGFLAVSRGDSLPSPSGSLPGLFYTISICDPFCHEVAAGFGTIPSGDLSGSARTTLRLETNTSGNPNFTTLVGPAGRITVEWRKTDAFSQTQNATGNFVSGGFSAHFTGQSTQSSAMATGSVVGFAFSRGFGQLGTNRSVSIDLFH